MAFREGLFCLAFWALVVTLIDAFFLARCNLHMDQRGAPSFSPLYASSLGAVVLYGTGPGLLFLTEEGTPPPLDLNSVTEEELMLLPGIGPKRALQIIEARYENGFFLTKEELISPYGPIPPTLYWAIEGLVR